MTQGRLLAFIFLPLFLFACSGGPNLAEWDPSSENVTQLEVITNSDAIDNQASSLGGQEILFSSNRQENMDIWSTNLSGGGSRQLTNYGGPDRYPSPHPNGQKYTFLSDRGGNIAYYLGDKEKPLSTRLTEVTEPEYLGYSPGPISPDSSKMAYASGRHVWTYNLSSNRGTQLVTGHQPSWYPSGEKIIFIRKSEGDSGVTTSIWSMNVDGTSLTEVVSSNEQAIFLHPSVSPDGQRIAYVKATLEQADASLSLNEDDEEAQSRTIGDGEQFENLDIFISDVDGTNRVRLTTNPLPDVDPEWISNDQIVFTSERPKSSDLDDRNWNVWVLSI